jgi:hypothetical protein
MDNVEGSPTVIHFGEFSLLSSLHLSGDLATDENVMALSSFDFSLRMLFFMIFLD